MICPVCGESVGESLRKVTEKTGEDSAVLIACFRITDWSFCCRTDTIDIQQKLNSIPESFWACRKGDSPMYSVITQAVGFVGTGIVIAAFQCKDTKKLMFVHALAGLLYTLHFFMLGSIIASFSQFLFTVNIFLLNDTKHRWASWVGWRYVISALLILVTVVTWKGPADLLPCAASVATTLTNWSRNGRIIRLNRLCFASPAWIIYDIIVGSPSGIACEVFSMGSVLISIYRYGWSALDN